MDPGSKSPAKKQEAKEKEDRNFTPFDVTLVKVMNLLSIRKSQIKSYLIDLHNHDYKFDRRTRFSHPCIKVLTACAKHEEYLKCLFELCHFACLLSWRYNCNWYMCMTQNIIANTASKRTTECIQSS